VQVEAKLPAASAYQAAGIYGLLRTHERLDAGEPTEIHATLNVTASLNLDKLINGRLEQPPGEIERW
jgi:hypothetical protein